MIAADWRLFSAYLPISSTAYAARDLGTFDFDKNLPTKLKSRKRSDIIIF